MYLDNASSKSRATVISICAVLITFSLVSTILYNSMNSHLWQDSSLVTEKALSSHLVKPNVPIVAVIFYGRKRFFSILDCYLRQNLVSNGGWLDEVRIILNTKDEEDLAFVKGLVETNNIPEYNLIDYRARLFEDIFRLYFSDPDPNTIYVKIDDDLVFIEPQAIPRIVTTLLAHPDALHVQANTINNKGTHYFHHRTRALRPFLPDPATIINDTDFTEDPFHGEIADTFLHANLLDDKAPIEWRTSSLPLYTNSTAIEPTPYSIRNLPWPQSSQLQKWLPLPNTWANLQQTPAFYSPPLDQPSWGGMLPQVDWGLAAQEHYSLFHHLEHNTLESYYFGDSHGLWNPGDAHYNIHLMAIRGSTLKQYPFWEWRSAREETEHDKTDQQENEQSDGTLPSEALDSAGNFLYRGKTYSDEWALTEYIPRNFSRYYLVDSRAIAAHYAFHMPPSQEKPLIKTDVLQRYAAYAQERVCRNWP